MHFFVCSSARTAEDVTCRSGGPVLTDIYFVKICYFRDTSIALDSNSSSHTPSGQKSSSLLKPTFRHS